MEKSSKNAIIISSVLLVGGLIYYFMVKGKEKKEGGGKIGGLLGNKLTLTTGKCFYGKVGIIKSQRKKANDDFIKEGAEFEVKDTSFDGKYKVAKIYRDDNGLIDFVTPTPSFPTTECMINEEFDGKGKIIFKK